jgi:hypothetical protein
MERAETATPTSIGSGHHSKEALGEFFGAFGRRYTLIVSVRGVGMPDRYRV